MTVDPYAMCPGGTGKKVKFCCPDLVTELGKLEQQQAAGQTAAALTTVERLLERFPERNCLMSIHARLLRASGDMEAAHGALAKLVESDPSNPLALAETTLQAIESDAGARAAVDRFQETLAALPTDEPLPEYALNALDRLCEYLLTRGEVWSARVHLELGNRVRRSESRFRFYLAVLQSPRISLLMKSLPGYAATLPAGAPWLGEFERALEASVAGRLAEAADLIEALTERFPDEPMLWRQLAGFSADLIDKPRAIAALRRWAGMNVPLDDAVEAEALAQSFAEEDMSGNLDIVAAEFEIDDADAVQATLDAHPRVSPTRFDPRERADAEGVAPRAVFKLVDRPRPASGEGLTLDATPRVLADLLLFGKQTDRPARLGMVTYRDQRFAEIQKALAEIVGENLGRLREERVVGHTGLGTRSLAVELDFPADTSAGHRLDLMQRLQREIVWEIWPHTPKEVLGRRTPAEAAGDPTLRIAALASILRLEAAQLPTTSGFDFNTLRQKLNLPLSEPIDFHELKLEFLPPLRLGRVACGPLSDEDLARLHEGAVLVTAITALRNSAEEMLRRPSILKEVPAEALHGELARLNNDPRLALPHLAAAAKAAEDAGRSPAIWLLEEVPLRLAIGQIDDALALVQRLLQHHGREPGVREAVSQLLESLGIDLRAEAGPQAEAPGDAKLWTPGGDAPAKGKKSPLWVPGMDL